MLTVISSSRFADHLTPPGHPERPERAAAMAAVVARFRDAGGPVLEPRAATDDDLRRVHTPARRDTAICSSAVVRSSISGRAFGPLPTASRWASAASISAG